ncbi:predicted protein [Chaetoceros tenuissimus]|uniref:Uncharacterized protein n=1 Tax=Chaetoceros tenuissimus TaxID=426638 RepID=A0AAD3D987_9STRA|nr:predicted protein [Chaetoceros tenuissimus]
MQEFIRKKELVFPSNEENSISNETGKLVDAWNKTSEVVLASMSSAKSNVTKPKERLAKSTLSILLNVFTIDGESPIVEFSEEAKDILNSSSETERAHVLETLMRRAGLFNTHLSLQQSKDICDGKLGWRSNEVPGGTSMLLVQRDKLDHRMGNAETLRIIDLKSKNVGLDNETFEKLTKTSIILPKTVTELIENVDTICKVFHIFSDDCFVARKLDDLVSKLRMNQSTIQSYCNKNEDGVTLILAAFDRKLKNFIDQVGLFPENLGHICSQLNFDKIISNLEDGTFHFTDVPSCIKGLKERCNKRRKFDDDEESIEQSLSETE